MKPVYWRLGGIAAALLILVAAWFLLVNPQRDTAAQLTEQTAQEQTAAVALQARIDLLKKQSEELPQKEAELAAIGQRLPPTAGISSLIRNLTKVARKAEVTMSALAPGQPTAIELAAPAAPAPTATAAAADATATAAPVAPQAPSASVMAIPVAITACGSYAQLRDFLGGLEAMQRAILVSGLSISKGDCANTGDDRALTATITASAFTLPVALPADGETAQPVPSATAGAAS